MMTTRIKPNPDEIAQRLARLDPKFFNETITNHERVLKNSEFLTYTQFLARLNKRGNST